MLKHTVSYGNIVSPETWGRSSAGRAPALQAGGQEFDSPRLHHFMSKRRFNNDVKARCSLKTAQKIINKLPL